MDQNSPPVPKFSSKSFYTPLIISLFGIASSALMILVYQFLILKFCMRTRNTAASDTAAVRTSEIPAATGGVDEKLLDTIPILAYSAENRDLFRLDQTECAVCLGELEEEKMVRLLPSCKHAFHVQCIDQWFMGHVSCPLCRSPVGEPAEATIVVLPVEVRSEVRDGENEATMGENINASSITGGARVSIRHSASMVFARERREKGLLEGNFKRSLSMDQSFLVIDVERESERACSSSSSSSSAKDDVTRRESYTTSSRLLRSFSRLRAARVGSGDGNGNGMVLPC